MKKMTIKRNTSTHYTERVFNRHIKYLVMHYTAGLKSYAGKGSSTCDYFRHAKRPGSADYVADDGNVIWQYNPDPYNRKTYHCGGKLQGSGGHKYYGICTNANSIGLEMSSDKLKPTKLLYSSDKDWYIHPDVWESAVAAAAILLNKFNIPLSRMIRHYDVTGKECPAFMCGSKRNEYYDNRKGDDIWDEFRADVKKALAELTGKEEKDTEEEVKLTKKQKFVKGLQKSLNKDYDCGLAVDCSYGPKTESALAEHNIGKGSKYYCAMHLQYWLNDRGFRDDNNDKLSLDGDFGKLSVQALKNCQRKLGYKGDDVDGMFGAGTCERFMKLFD